MTVRELLNTCENWDEVRIYKIRVGVDTEIAFDPIDDTDLVQVTSDMRDIDNDYLNMNVQCWSMTSLFGIWVCV